MSQSSKLVDINGLEHHSGVPKRTLRTLYQRRKIPYIKPGYRTVLFDPDKVMVALNKFEVRAVTSK
jgi:hypothetical protein